MKKIFLLGATTSLLGGFAIAALFASEYEREEYGKPERNASRGVGMADNASYASECGACHFAYQPGLLPAASWTKLMDGLADHFGENTELDDETRQALTRYLTENAGDVKPNKVFYELFGRSREAPLRITELQRFNHEHGKIPQHLVKDNLQVQSLSHCARCHTDAEQGFYNEHRVMIPGYGRFED